MEGLREVRHCLEAGYKADTLFLCPEIFDASPENERPALPDDVRTVEVPTALYERIAVRSGSEGIIAQVFDRSHALEDLSLPENPLVVVVEKLEKPGNLGAILRSADGAGADALIVCDSAVELTNPNAVRSSLGSLVTVPVALASSAEAISFLKAHRIQILTAQLQDSRPYYDIDMRGGTALVIGSESDGLTAPWREAADRHVLIPMLGRMDSLNASVSAAILLYEAVRQRSE